MGERRATRAGKAVLALAVGLVVAFYAWTASNGVTFGVREPQDGHYNLLTQAFLRGQLHLLVAPRPELFELADPLDPTKNAPYRLHDASLYHGKYYLYFGAAPVVALFVPWSLVGLGDLPESLAALIFSAGAFALASLLMRHIVRRHLPETPFWLQAVGIVGLGFANVAPFNLRGAGVYEVAISAGAFFLMASAWAFVTAADAQPVSVGRLALGSLCLGLAVGSRPNHVLLAPLFLLLAWPALGDATRRWRAAIAAIAPLAVCLLLVGAYNLARFGSWGDFGTRYCLVGHPPLPWFTPRVSLVPALYFHLVAPPAIKAEFPFLFADTRFPGELPEGFYAEATTGLLIHSPFLLVLVALPWLWRSRIALLAAIGASSLLVTALIVPWATMRYEADYAGFLALAACLLWFALDARLRGASRTLARALLVLMAAWTCIAIAALSITGRDDTLRLRNPELFGTLARRFARLDAWIRPLEGRFQPPRSLLGRVGGDDGRSRVRIQFRVAFPETLVRDREPLLSSGTVETHDVLWLRASSTRWMLQLSPARGGESSSAAFDVQPRAFHSVDVDLDRGRRSVDVSIDGGHVAHLSGELAPIRAATIVLGRGPRGRGAEDLGRFSGTILSQSMLDAAAPGLERLPPIATTPAVFAEHAPVQPVPGQLWISPAKDGARIFDGAGWRWIPR